MKSNTDFDGKHVEPDLKKGQLYQWNGHQLVPVEPSEVAKVPVSDLAMDAVKKVRGEATRVLGQRPDLAVVTSAMLLASLTVPDVVERVREYGFRLYQPRT